MKIQALTTVMILGIALFARCSYAQTIRLEGTARIWWEASMDNGTTWTQGLAVVPENTTSVLVRSQCQFDFPFLQNYYSGASLDATVQGMTGSGLTDSASAILRNTRGIQPLQATRFGQVLKIDDFDDPHPPGQGPLWVTVVQYAAISPVPTNPYWMLQYQLNLDGTSGDRLIDAVFRQPPTIPQGRYLAIGTYGSDVIYYPTLRIDPLTIRVIPAPGMVGLLFAGPVILVRRRRGPRDIPAEAGFGAYAALHSAGVESETVSEPSGRGR